MLVNPISKSNMPALYTLSDRPFHIPNLPHDLADCVIIIPSPPFCVWRPMTIKKIERLDRWQEGTMTDSHRYNHHHRVGRCSSYCQNGLSGARMKFMVIHCGQNISLERISEMEIPLNQNQCRRT
ncbi:hypothetical protein CEXT_748501 [Caerostris extrusa]|uniref:Uncharacterized protein n=1 Tax=Caerostris extrusa TaxID=172846 RepID=A0AAV4N7I4_CAEEX|nr:hypothetical protein CEXT_748501 [Caerostris extrusa]